jgi:hypothetical protein
MIPSLSPFEHWLKFGTYANTCKNTKEPRLDKIHHSYMAMAKTSLRILLIGIDAEDRNEEY